MKPRYAFVFVTWLLMTTVLIWAFKGHIRTFFIVPEKEQVIDTYNDFLHSLEHKGYWWAARIEDVLYRGARDSDIDKYRRLRKISNIPDKETEAKTTLERTSKNETFVLIFRKYGSLDFMNKTKSDEKFVAYSTHFFASQFEKYMIYHLSKEKFPGQVTYMATGRGHHHQDIIMKLLIWITENGIAARETMQCSLAAKEGKNHDFDVLIPSVEETLKYYFKPDIIDLKRLTNPLIYLAAGWTLGILTFIAEIILNWSLASLLQREFKL